MSHTVTITRLPDEQSDDYEYEFGGTHGFPRMKVRGARRRRLAPIHRTLRVFDDLNTAFRNVKSVFRNTAEQVALFAKQSTLDPGERHTP